MYIIPIFTALAGIIFYFAIDLIEIRTFTVSIAIFILSFLMSWDLIRYSPPENKLLYYSASIFIAVRGLTVLARAFLWQVDNQYNIFDNSIWSLIQLEFGLISEIGQNVIFLMMNSKRAEANFYQAESKLNSTVIELKKALSEVKKLSGLLPICSHCKKIRDDKGYWTQIESYIHEHSEAEFSHSICQECSDKLYGKEDWYIEMKNEETQKK